MKCNMCGKEMTSPDDFTMRGMTIHISAGHEASEADVAWAQKQMGPYKLDHDYEICLECWFRSIGIKP